jgi:hypothetical protein
MADSLRNELAKIAQAEKIMLNLDEQMKAARARQKATSEFQLPRLCLRSLHVRVENTERELRSSDQCRCCATVLIHRDNNEPA